MRDCYKNILTLGRSVSFLVLWAPCFRIGFRRWLGEDVFVVFNVELDDRLVHGSIT